MRKPHFLFVEDRKDTGEMLVEFLELRGFQATHVLSPEEAEQFAEKNPEAPDVLILDMHLGPGVPTGAEVGRKLLNHYSEEPPEVVFYTAFSDIPYYAAAVRMRIAAYLHKTGDDYKNVIAHCRILAIRRHIRLYAHQRLNLLRKIVRTHRQEIDIYQQSLKQRLLPAFEEVLGKPFCLLLRVGETHRVIGSKQLDRDLDLAQLQDLIANLPPGQYLSGKDPLLMEVVAEWDQPAYQKIISVPLFNSPSFQLTLVLDNDQEGSSIISEGSENLAAVMAQHLEPSLFERFFSLIDLLIQQEKQRRESILMTSRSCMAIAQIHEDLYQKALRRGEIDDEAYILPRFKSVSSSLKKVGLQIGSIEKETTLEVEVDLSQQAQAVWKELVDIYKVPKPEEIFDCEPTIFVRANPEDVRSVLRSIFTWMIDRFDAYDGRKPKVTIASEVENNIVRVMIEDNSQRLSEAQLGDLFSPFSSAFDFDDGFEGWLGLFMARMILRTRLDGDIQEHSGDLPHEYGHLLILSLRGISGESHD